MTYVTASFADAETRIFGGNAADNLAPIMAKSPRTYFKKYKNYFVYYMISWHWNNAGISDSSSWIERQGLIYRLLSGKLRYLQHNCVGDTIVYH